MDDLTTPKLRRIERRIDAQLRELSEMGELSGLPGSGKPLAPDPDAGAGDAWAARHVARNAEATPEWVELRKEIGARRDRIARRLRAHRAWLEQRADHLRSLPAERLVDAARATSARDARVRSEFDAEIKELNGLVARHNLSVVLSLQLTPVSLGALEDQAARSPR